MATTFGRVRSFVSKLEETSKMAYEQILGLVFISTFVLANGFSLDELRMKRQTMSPEDCSRPPTNGHLNLCCKLPKERIWGDLKSSFKKCFNLAKMERRLKSQRMGEDVDEKPTTTPTAQEDGNAEEETATPGSNFFVIPAPRTPGRRRLHYHFHQRRNDQCVMECVFQDQGFLSDKLVSKEALLRRVHATLGRNEMWHSVAVQAVEMCLQGDLGIPSNSTCQSGAEELFRCVFKHLFFHCPSWPEKNEYCRAVKEFYQRCPNGPPPPLEDRHTTTAPEPEEETEDIGTLMTTQEP